MKITRTLLIGSLFAMSLSTAFAANTGVSVRWSYENAATGQKTKENQAIELGDSSEAMRKTLLVVKASDSVTKALAAWAKTCNDTADAPTRPEPVARHSIRPSPRPPIHEGEEKFTEKCKAEKDAVVKAYVESISGFEAQIPVIEKYQYEQTVKAMQAAGERVNPSVVRRETQEPKLTNLITVLKKLAENMKNAKPERNRWLEMAPRSFSMRSAGPSMNVTTGGAQDAKLFRDKVTAGEVPAPSQFQAYGLINEFNLSISQNCAKYLCMSPSVAFDGKKMYVQVGLGVNVKEAEFQRRPINLAIALDRSGSMSATDKTKQDRLAWSKEAIRMTLKNLVEGQDYFTLVWFSDDAKVEWSPKDGSGKARPISEKDKADILKIIDDPKYQTIGSTNLRAGLDLAYSELNSVKASLEQQGKDDSYESRVIMITDANLNNGDTDESSAVIKVEDQSRSRGINLTTIGVGDNFFQDFINKLGVMRGANYIFAQDGQSMLEYFEQFDTLVTPYAYDFVANVAVSGKAKLVRVHGVPEVKGAAPSDSILSIKTLFLASSKKGGGAQVLEFDLE